MKEISRRSFLRTSALAGAAAVLAGAAPLAAGAASPAAVPEENCLDSLGTAVASLGNGTPVLPSVVGLSRGSIMGYCENGISKAFLTAPTSVSSMPRRWSSTARPTSPPTL